MKAFTTTGICNPKKHYMVDITDRLNAIKNMIDNGDYFTINRARQYGKTTTLAALVPFLKNQYYVLSLDFQSISLEGFKDEKSFIKVFSSIVCDKADSVKMPPEILDALKGFSSRNEDEIVFYALFKLLSRWCSVSDKPIVMIVDEVDSATNNQVFLDFLAQLRHGFLEREKSDTPTFQSVILAGVTDVKHLKIKIRPEDQHKVNSPWNIAVDFKIDMRLSVDGINGMLDEYECDHHTGMNTFELSQYIFDYTNGYPYLVSKLCSIIDESSQDLNWNRSGIDGAVKRLLKEENVPLFDSLTGKLTNFPELRNKLYRILMMGEVFEYLPYDEAQKQLHMFGFIKEDNGIVRISNRIFETLLYNHFLGEDTVGNEIKQSASYYKNHFVNNGILNVRLVLERFIVIYKQVFGELEDRFREKDGREIFLIFLKPIINGVGNYYIEAQTRDQRRMDIIIDYLGIQYIIELKIWRGERYNSEGEKQIADYLDYYGIKTGYMLSFNFNKNKEPGVKEITYGDKVLIEAVL